MSTEVSTTIPTLDYLAWVARQIRLDGRYVAQQERDGTPTWLGAIREYDEWGHLNLITHGPTQGDFFKAQDCLNHFRAQNTDDALSDYLQDLIELMKSDLILRNELALAASALLVYERAEARRERAEAERALRQTSRPVGEPGEVITAEVFVEQVRALGEGHAAGLVHALRDRHGNRYAWFTNARTLHPGWWYRLTGEIKRHELFHGEHSTVLKWARVVAVVEEGSQPQ